MKDLASIVYDNSEAGLARARNEVTPLDIEQMHKNSARCKLLSELMDIEGYTLEDVQAQIRELYEDAMREQQVHMDRLISLATNRGVK